MISLHEVPDDRGRCGSARDGSFRCTSEHHARESPRGTDRGSVVDPSRGSREVCGETKSSFWWSREDARGKSGSTKATEASCCVVICPSRDGSLKTESRLKWGLQGGSDFGFQVRYLVSEKHTRILKAMCSSEYTPTCRNLYAYHVYIYAYLHITTTDGGNGH
jgi:hypothetical protein